MIHPLKFLAGLLTGVAVGSAAALILAPGSGRQVRDSLAREAKKITVKATGLHPDEWSDLAAEEIGRNLVENLERIRSAGL